MAEDQQASINHRHWLLIKKSDICGCLGGQKSHNDKRGSAEGDGSGREEYLNYFRQAIGKSTVLTNDCIQKRVKKALKKVTTLIVKYYFVLCSVVRVWRFIGLSSRLISPSNGNLERLHAWPQIKVPWTYTNIRWGSRKGPRILRGQSHHWRR